MPLTYAEIDAQVAARLDAEGSDHYRDIQDRIPAINAAMDFIVAGVGTSLDRRKFSSKLLSELQFTNIWQTSFYGRVQMHEAALVAAGRGPIWDLVACHMEPELIPANPALTVAPDINSALRQDLSFDQSAFECKRLTHEQYAETKSNPLMAGSEYLAGSDLRSYWYMIHSNQGSGFWDVEFGPRTLTSKVFVAITYLKMPVSLTAITDTLPFPVMARELIVSRALHYISIKTGDQTILQNTTDQDTGLLMKMLT